MNVGRGMIALLGATALGVGFGYWLAGGSAAVAHSTARSAALGSADPAQGPQPPNTAKRVAPAPMRVAIQSAIERAPVHAAPEVAAYLDSLEARARAQRAVTALEVEPGIAMIRRYSFEPEEEIERFAERMQAVQHEFTPPESPRPAPEVHAELDRLVVDIARPKDEAEKQASIAHYLEVARQLDEEPRDAALRRLNQIAGAAPPAADAETVNVLWSAIERARDPTERQALIANYLELVHALPEQDGQARLAELSKRFGSQGR